MGDPTKFATRTLANALNAALPGEIESALAQIALGTMLAPLKITVTGLSAATVVNVTKDLTNANTTVNYGAPTQSNDLGISVPGASGGLPPILEIASLRVTGAGGGNKPGVYITADSGGTAYDAGASSVGVALLSDDGTTLTFNSQVTAFVLSYMPRPLNNPSTTTFTPETKA